MKQKVKLFVFASLLIGITSCKKEEVSVIDNKNTASEIRIKQKMYELSPEQNTATIRKFKELNSAKISNRVSHNATQTDSSIWIIEAALNYDFDSAQIQVKSLLIHVVSTSVLIHKI